MYKFQCQIFYPWKTFNINCILHHLAEIVQYSVETSWTFQNVTNDNFDSLKQHLTAKVADALQMPSSSLRWKVNSGSNLRSKRSATNLEMILIVSAKDEVDSSKIKLLINSESFKESFNKLARTSEILKNAGVVLNTINHVVTTANIGNIVFNKTYIS